MREFDIGALSGLTRAATTFVGGLHSRVAGDRSGDEKLFALVIVISLKPISGPSSTGTTRATKSYRWTKPADEILSSVKRFCQKAEQTLCSEL